MASIRLPQRRAGRLLAALAALAATAALTAGPAAADAGSGLATLSFAKQGKATSLSAQGVKVFSVGPDGGSETRNGAQSVELPIAELTLSGGAAKALASSQLKFSLGKRKALFKSLTFDLVGDQTSVSAKLGKRQLVLFRAEGAVALDASSVSLDKATLRLTGNAARALATRLGLDQAAPGKLGSAHLGAKLTATPASPAQSAPDTLPLDKDKAPAKVHLDPYFEQCGVEATSEVAGSLPAAAPLPVLADAKSVVDPDAVAWGFKTSFRGYIFGAAGGSLQTLDGASTNGPPPVFSSFNFPLTEGEYADNDPVDMTDDQAVLAGSGKALFCGTGHEFRVVISNPTVVIDGADSRIVADVDTNLNGVWTPAQRIDLADLNLAGITPFYNHSGAEVSWGAIPATLTEEGAEAICGGGGCGYVEGTALDTIDVSVKTPYDTGAGDAAAWTALASYVGTELPFPLPTPSQGGCTLPGSAGGTAGAARTIDEHVALGGTTTMWNPDGSRPLAQPNLSSGGTVVTGGNFDWGFRRSLRGSVNGTGEFNPALGATASEALYYGFGGQTPVFPRPNPPGAGQMANNAGDPGKYFRWPAASGTYQANAAGNADDRLVLQTSGRVAFCQTQSAQQYGTVFSNPAIVIDGANSRITIDVATRYRLSWVRGRVDIATLDLSAPGVTVNQSSAGGTTTVEWKFPDANETVTPNTGPVALTKAGESVVNMISKTGYLQGLGLDGAAIKASFPDVP